MELPGGVLNQADQASSAHYAAHARFAEGCAVCRQARANFEPYPVRPSPPDSRSFGFTDKLTPDNIRAMAPPPSRYGFDTSEDVEFSLSLAVIRFILRLIWPFSRIL
jgi:hypothetical protein